MGLPWRAVRESVEVKLLAEDGELYILAQSRARIAKERGMRRRRLKKLWRRLHELIQSLKRDELLLKLRGGARAGGDARGGRVRDPGDLHLRVAAHRLRRTRRREGRYLLRSNLTGEDPAMAVLHAAHRDRAGVQGHDLALRPIFHQREERIEAHIFVAFIAYCLHVTLKNLARPRAPGLTPRAVLEKFATMQMVDVRRPPTGGAWCCPATPTTADHQLLLRPATAGTAAPRIA